MSPAPCPGPVAATEAAFDPLALEAAMGPGHALLARVRRGFLQSAAATVEEMRGAHAQQALQPLGAAAHRLRSSARSVGALALAQLCADIETAVRRHDDARALQLAEGLEPVWRHARDRLRAQLRDGAATSVARVLVVDDDPFARDLLRAMLHQRGVTEVDTASSGPAALERLNDHHDRRMLLLIDLQMPGMDGLALLEALADFGYGGRLALVSSAGERMRLAAQALAQHHGLQVLGQLGKPIVPSQLEHTLLQWRTANMGATP